MDLDKEHRESILELFSNLTDKKDLLDLINYVHEIIYGDKVFPIKPGTLNYYALPSINQNRYRSFNIPKKSGGKREIHAPVGSLKYIQKSLNTILNTVFQPHTSAKGFVPGKSIVNNAIEHRSMNFVFNIDLKDFFHHIELHRVKAVLKLPPFYLKEDKEPIAFLIANICCYETEVERIDEKGRTVNVMRSVLPMGAPTSPVITNIISQKLDRRLNGLAKKYGVTYTRYADDITFSSQQFLYNPEGKFITEMRRIIDDQGFSINEKKVRLQKNAYRQEVTGLTVNEKPNVSRRYIKNLRFLLYLWETYGYERANDIFKEKYKEDKTYYKKIPQIDKAIKGKLGFLKMVKGKQDSTYRKLYDRFYYLIRSNKEYSRKTSLDNVLNTLIKSGLEAAMKEYTETL